MISPSSEVDGAKRLHLNRTEEVDNRLKKENSREHITLNTGVSGCQIHFPLKGRETVGDNRLLILKIKFGNLTAAV